MQADQAIMPPLEWATVWSKFLGELYRVVAGLPMLLVAVILVWASWRIGSWLAKRKVLGRLNRSNPLLKDLLASTVRGAALLIGIVAALEVMNATAIATALLGTAGVIGVALGFAFKDIVENYVAGILMSLRRPFNPHDHVRIAEHEGFVAAMSTRATLLLTPDGNHLRVPNALVFKSVTLNFTRNPTRRFEFDFQVAHDRDPGAAGVVAMKVLASLPEVLDDPSPQAFVVSAGTDQYTLRAAAWIDQRHHDLDAVKGRAIQRVLGEARRAPPRAEPSARALAAPMQRRDDPVTNVERHGAGVSHNGAADLLDPAAPEE